MGEQHAWGEESVPENAENTSIHASHEGTLAAKFRQPQIMG